MSATRQMTRRYVKSRKLSDSPFLPNIGPMMQKRGDNRLPNTRSAMLQFQRYYGLPRTGQMDQRTSAKMRQVRIRPASPPAPRHDPRVRRRYGKPRATRQWT